MNVSVVMAQSGKKVWPQHQTEGDLYKNSTSPEGKHRHTHTHVPSHGLLTSVLHWWHHLSQLGTSGAWFWNTEGSWRFWFQVLVAGSQDAAGSWARASRCRGCELLLFVCSGGRRLLLEGRIPAGGRLHRALLHVVALLGSVEGQPPEERQLIGGQRLSQCFGLPRCENLLWALLPFCRLLIGCWSCSLASHWPVCCLLSPFPRLRFEAAQLLQLLLTKRLAALEVFHLLPSVLSSQPASNRPLSIPFSLPGSDSFITSDFWKVPMLQVSKKSNTVIYKSTEDRRWTDGTLLFSCWFLDWRHVLLFLLIAVFLFLGFVFIFRRRRFRQTLEGKTEL